MEVQFHGLRRATLPPSQLEEATAAGPEKGGDDAEGVRRKVLVPKTAFVVREGDAFVQFVPDNVSRLTVGLDRRDAKVGGGQWGRRELHSGVGGS